MQLGRSRQRDVVENAERAVESTLLESTPQRLRIFLEQIAVEVCNGTPEDPDAAAVRRPTQHLPQQRRLAVSDPPTRDMTRPDDGESGRGDHEVAVHRPETFDVDDGSPPHSAPAHIGEDDREESPSRR